MEKAYICNLKFDIYRWQLWFMAEDSIQSDEKWREALRSLGEVGDACVEAEEFYRKAISHFEAYGFAHVAK